MCVRPFFKISMKGYDKFWKTRISQTNLPTYINKKFLQTRSKVSSKLHAEITNKINKNVTYFLGKKFFYKKLKIIRLSSLEWKPWLTQTNFILEEHVFINIHPCHKAQILTCRFEVPLQTKQNVPCFQKITGKYILSYGAIGS